MRIIVSIDYNSLNDSLNRTCRNFELFAQLQENSSGIKADKQQ